MWKFEWILLLLLLYLAKITGIIIDLTEIFMTIAYMPTQHILSINFCQNNWQIKK